MNVSASASLQSLKEPNAERSVSVFGHDLRFDMHIMVVSGHCCWELASLMFHSLSFRNPLEVEAGDHDCICWAYREYIGRIRISRMDKSDGRGQETEVLT